MKTTMKKERMLRRCGHLAGLVVLMMVLAGSFLACSDDDGPESGVIWDIYPIVLSFNVQDAAGNDLLNPETPGNLCGQKVIAYYKDKVYEKDSLQNLQSRMYLARLYGLYDSSWTMNDGKHLLKFGEFQGEDTYENEEVILEWEDGTKDVVTFSSRMAWKKHKPVFTRSFTLNGKDNDGKELFVLTKNPAVPSEPDTPTENDPNEPHPDVEWDLAPIVLNFQVQDAAGNDLLNPKTPGNLCNQKVTAYYQGKAYAKDSLENLYSRVYVATLYGLYPNPTVDHEGKHRLLFGELAAEKTYENEEVTLEWEDGTKDVFTFSSSLKWENYKPVFNRSYTFNGKDNEGKALFVLTKKPATTE